MVYTMSKRVNPSINAVSTLVVVIITVALVIINVVPAIMAKRPKKAEMSKRRIAIPCTIGAVVVAGIIAIFAMKPEVNPDLPYSGQTLYIYLPGEYMGEEIVPMFEEQTGATVIVENFDSNEQAYIKVTNGESYDIIIPSDYMIQRLMQEGYLQKLDQSLITCWDELDEAVLSPAFDPNNEYSVSYFWGTVGIVYDKTKVSEEDLEEQGFGIFLNEKYKGDIYLYDSERDSFMMALKDLGYSMNTENEAELQEAYEWLVQCVTTMEPEIVTDEIIDNMAQGRKALGLCYSGDATYIMSENENMGFYMPEDGTNRWYDSMVIPTTAESYELAHEFMNFVNSYDMAYANSDWVGYTSPNLAVKEDLSSEEEEGSYAGINAYIPRTDHPLDEVFVFNEEVKKLMGNLWSKVKIAASNAK
jgi:spermidine/putrescine transport system permease protein